MNSFRKVIFAAILFFSCLSFGFAATGTSQTGTNSDYSGDLSKYAEGLKNNLISQIDSGYDKLYGDFQKTGLNIMKTIDYQSLVCLGILQSDSGMFLSMQTDKQNLKKEILKAFADIQIEVSTLEEKNRILEKNGVNLFDSTNGYEYEKKQLKKEIDGIFKNQKTEISTYIDNYSLKIKTFISDFTLYKSGNKELIASISDKIFKVKQILDSYSGLVLKISKLNDLLFSSSVFSKAVDNLKSVALNNYEKKLEKTIDKQLKRYAKLSGLESVLEEEKAKSLSEYSDKFDRSLFNVFGKFYRYDTYISLMNSVDDLENSYYTRGKYNCKNLLISNSVLPTKLNLLTKDISNVLSSVDSGMKLAQNTGYSKKFRTDIVSAITNFYKTPSTEVYKNFENAISEKIKELNFLVNSGSNQEPISQNTGVEAIFTGNNSLIEVPLGFSFKTPFKLNQKSEDIKILQKLLIKLSYYTGEINGIYDNSTLNAVYSFQQNNGLLVGYEKKPNVWGWMGPATRTLLNSYLNK